MTKETKQAWLVTDPQTHELSHEGRKRTVSHDKGNKTKWTSPCSWPTDPWTKPWRTQEDCVPWQRKQNKPDLVADPQTHELSHEGHKRTVSHDKGNKTKWTSPCSWPTDPWTKPWRTQEDCVPWQRKQNKTSLTCSWPTDPWTKPWRTQEDCVPWQRKQNKPDLVVDPQTHELSHEGRKRTVSHDKQNKTSLTL